MHPSSPASDDAKHPEVSPLFVGNRALQPPAFIVSAEHDILRDQVETYVAKLAKAGVEVHATRAPAMMHSFWRWPELIDAARGAVRDVTAALNAFRMSRR